MVCSTRAPSASPSPFVWLLAHLQPIVIDRYQDAQGHWHELRNPDAQGHWHNPDANWKGDVYLHLADCCKASPAGCAQGAGCASGSSCAAGGLLSAPGGVVDPHVCGGVVESPLLHALHHPPMQQYQNVAQPHTHISSPPPCCQQRYPGVPVAAAQPAATTMATRPVMIRQEIVTPAATAESTVSVVVETPVKATVKKESFITISGELPVLGPNDKIRFDGISGDLEELGLTPEEIQQMIYSHQHRQPVAL